MKLHKKYTYQVISAMLGVALIGGCAWVSPNVDSQWVALVKPQAVASCRQIGETHSKTLTKVVVVGRSAQKQQNELITLAKNQAAVMSGDTIVAKGDMKDGEQTFKVYDCH
ncbi:DUF4156 domain-containing protein [Marinagarivorans algicola]|uniref:DUF4156 domain-containing protein n=1 Tax=Marinagarivorans algicola TaxID=1513270 RepID=UPI0006B69902|nr:DUF4156 domain-containing protein [Marinagarivorans algicola]